MNNSMVIAYNASSLTLAYEAGHIAGWQNPDAGVRDRDHDFVTPGHVMGYGSPGNPPIQTEEQYCKKMFE